MLKFAAICPHPPLLLPGTGSENDKLQVKKTIESLEFLGRQLKVVKPDCIIISSPHQNWGFNVPLHFLVSQTDPNFQDKVEPYLIGSESPRFYFEKGKEVFTSLDKDKRYALIASGDLSHCLKEKGPYGFHPQGPKFDKALIGYLEKKDIENFLKLSERFPEAGECGLRSFCFMLGILKASGANWQPKVLSYEAPFGVGYLVANFLLQ